MGSVGGENFDEFGYACIASENSQRQGINLLKYFQQFNCGLTCHSQSFPHTKDSSSTVSNQDGLFAQHKYAITCECYLSHRIISDQLA